MQLLPQSREALDEYVATVDDLEHELRVIEGWAVRTVPECVAMSVTLLDDDLTFTLVASPGPGVAGVGEGSETSTDEVPVEGASADLSEAALDEGWWAEMARSRAWAGIASTVSLPVVDHGRVVLTIDLYASTAHAFHGRLDALADALGASQAGAVTNADLGFDTRRRAEEAPAGCVTSASSMWRSVSSRPVRAWTSTGPGRCCSRALSAPGSTWSRRHSWCRGCTRADSGRRDHA